MNTRQRYRRTSGVAGALLIGAWIALTVGSCGDSTTDGGSSAEHPNIVWIVWDTVRADRMSLHGHHRDTTPFLDEWAKDARVFENCLSTGSSTVPSHGAMFTAKLPSRHGAREGHLWLDDRHETIAELLGGAGYQTYLWSSNPHISREENFQQGFDVEEHPWDDDFKVRANRIVGQKLQRDRTSELSKRFGEDTYGAWAIKAAGGLAEVGLKRWMEQRDRKRPFFAFLNYMEAHRPFLPAHEYRERMMSPEKVERSYRVDRSWIPLWAFSFGLHEYSAEELEVMAATYDATLAELDALLESLVKYLRESGELDNTVIVLTSDHGEHLGEHHLLDHQYSLYQDLIRVPLVLYAPDVVAAGRDDREVSNFDIFPTLLELAGIAPPEDLYSSARSLLDPATARRRVAEIPAVFTEPWPMIRQVYPQFDPTPFARRLRTMTQGRYKLIWGEDGRHELYDLSVDPEERNDLIEREPERAAQMLREMAKLAKVLDAPLPTSGTTYTPSPEHLEMLRGLGYAGEDDEDEEEEKK